MCTQGDNHDCPPSLYRFGLQSLAEVSPTSVHDTLGQVVVAHHILDLQIFDGDSVILADQLVRQLVQEVLASILDAFMLTLKQADCLTPVSAAFGTPSNTALATPQFRLLFPIPLGIAYLLAVAGDDHAGDANVHAYHPTDWLKWLRFDLAREAGVPMPRLADDTHCLNLSLNWTMPTHSKATDTREFQPATIDLEPVAVFLQAKAIKPVAPLEAGIAGSFASFHPPKERLKRLVEIGNNNLQDVTVDVFGVRTGGLERLDLAQLFNFAN
jgi:hypothetical protein